MKNNWIPCSERLPEEVNGESKAVLAIVRHVDFDGLVYSENYQIVWRENGEWACRGRVIAWMPLPEPYEEN